MNITLIAGTNRANSRTGRVTKYIQKRFEHHGVSTTRLDLVDLPMELLSSDAYDETPRGFLPFSEAVLHSDGLYVVAPEYNGSFPGALKLFIDHLPFPESFEQRPVAFTGIAAGIFGNLRGIEQLQMVFGYRNAHIFPKRIFISGASRTVDAEGGLTDPKAAQRLEQQIIDYIDFVTRLRAES